MTKKNSYFCDQHKEILFQAQFFNFKIKNKLFLRNFQTGETNQNQIKICILKVISGNRVNVRKCSQR